ncbi:hypothetical protein [Neisseria sp.]|uniref:hypothetical protein n=1 Tax=Neisseria sp. TaxID=192066 RepID=UPI0035A1B122
MKRQNVKGRLNKFSDGLSCRKKECLRILGNHFQGGVRLPVAVRMSGLSAGLLKIRRFPHLAVQSALTDNMAV